MLVEACKPSLSVHLQLLVAQVVKLGLLKLFSGVELLLLHLHMIFNGSFERERGVLSYGSFDLLKVFVVGE